MMDCEECKELLVNMCLVFDFVSVKEAIVIGFVAWYSEYEMLTHLMRLYILFQAKYMTFT